jgi:hypothetical protein
MQEVKQVVAAAGRRVFLNSYLRALAWTLTVAIGLAIAARLAQQTIGLTLDWTKIGLGLAAGSFAVALIWSLIKKAKPVAVAREVDEKADLRESLSTAMYVEKDAAQDPWAASMVETARRTATGVNVSRVIPIEWTRQWLYPIVGGVALLVAWVTIPNFDLAGLTKKREEIAKKEADIVVAKTQVNTAEKKIKEALEKAGIALKDEKADPMAEQNGPDPTKAEEIRRAGLKKLTNMAEQIQDKMEGPKGKELSVMKDMMEQLKSPGPGPLAEMQRMMARGEFGKAEQALQELQKQLSAGAMSADQKEQLQTQLQQLAKQMKGAEAKQQAAAEALKKAGLDQKEAEAIAKQMAKDPAAAKQALEKALAENKSMTPQQKQQAEEMAKALEQACSKCNGMGENMSQMAENMSKNGMGQQGQEAMSKLGEQMSEMEQMQSEMEAMQAALSEAQEQMEGMGQSMGEMSGMLANSDQVGQFEEGDSAQQGAGSGGPGNSGGGRGPEENPAAYTLQKDKANVKTTKGQIIGSRLVYGEQVRGESVAEFTDAVERGSQQATEAFETLRVHREYSGAVKHYFGRLEEQARKAKAAKDGKSPDGPVKTSEDAKGAASTPPADGEKK